MYNDFLESLLPGNYALTKSMELTKVQDSGTLWYTKKLKTDKQKLVGFLWRRVRDSNPRAIARKLISSRSRYPDFERKCRKITDDVRA